MSIFTNLANNIYKEKRLIIIDSSLPYLGKEKLSSNYYFKSDIMAICNIIIYSS